MKEYPNKRIGNKDTTETPVTNQEQEFFFPGENPVTVRAKSLKEAVEKRDIIIKKTK